MFQTRQRTEAKQFLSACKASVISKSETDTSRRVVYEIDVLENGTTPKTEVWIEYESKLEEPEYYYKLLQFKG